MVKKLMVRVDDEQVEFFGGDCMAKLGDKYESKLAVVDSSDKNIALFDNWVYWRYTDEK